VRENEKDWAFERSARGSSAPDKDNKLIVYVTDHWKNDNGSVRVNDVLCDSIEDAQQSLSFYAASRSVSPDKSERIVGVRLRKQKGQSSVDDWP